MTVCIGRCVFLWEPRPRPKAQVLIRRYDDSTDETVISLIRIQCAKSDDLERTSASQSTRILSLHLGAPSGPQDAATHESDSVSGFAKHLFPLRDSNWCIRIVRVDRVPCSARIRCQFVVVG